jgi:hypothetical protein
MFFSCSVFEGKLLETGAQGRRLVRATGLTPQDVVIADYSRHSAEPQPIYCHLRWVAMRFGFWHLGRFSGEYKRSFEESPSTTLRR